MSSTADDLAIDRQATIERVELAPHSWVEVARGFVRDPVAAFDELHATLPWQQNEVLRYDRYIPERRLGTGVRASDHVVLRQTELHLQSRYRVSFTGVAALLYRDGNDFQGIHSDREMRWLDETLIAILVLGTRRPFVLRPRADGGVPVERIPAGTGPDDLVLTPGEGDLLVMGGACQREWLHGIPAAPGVESPRISLTWRWTSKRGRPDTNPTYGDGRHFSDSADKTGRRQPGTRTRQI